jgi:TetR/AcrR family transcriptional regulator, tetracycline repressor protein
MPAARGRPPRLSRERIVDAALALIDRVGVDGLTMRALAKDLGVDPMAVYRHVRDKDDLLAAMCDQLLGDLDPLEPEGEWEPQFRRLGQQILERLLERPSLVPVLARAPITPAAVVVARDVIELLARGGFPPRLAVGAADALLSHVLGHALLVASAPAAPDAERLEVEVRAQLGLADGDAGPPHLETALGLVDEPGDFDLGLDLLIAGLRARRG